MLSLWEQEAGLNPRRNDQTGPQEAPQETEDARWQLRRRNPLRRKAAVKALIVPAFFLSLLGCALLIWALRDDEAAPVRDLRQQAAAAAPVRAPEPANPSARAPAPTPPPPAELAPILPPPLPAAIVTPSPAPPKAPETLQSNPLRPTPEASPVAPALAMAPVRATSLSPTPNRESVQNAQREAAAVASAAREAARPASAKEREPAKEREREPVVQAASVEKAGDSFVIVLATVETESEARAQLQQIHKKYAGLGLKKLGYTRVKSGNDYVWRVRSSGWSEEEADEICEKIGAAGGKCTTRSN